MLACANSRVNTGPLSTRVGAQRSLSKDAALRYCVLKLLMLHARVQFVFDPSFASCSDSYLSRTRIYIYRVVPDVKD